jgi:hypothetical protein
MKLMAGSGLPSSGHPRGHGSGAGMRLAPVNALLQHERSGP